ncbi:MAG TPA: LuxR C-terminal-related transcriptional regulator [Candidatus Elarobacter sp.]|nr:LuxR C-terminal-related transcriptional regulator [Candidatus Elarobacter sp.]
MATLDPGEYGLLDRDAVLREIDAYLREARARSSPAIVRVVGAPGIGKTAVLRRAASAHAGTMVFVTAEPASQSEAGSTRRRLADARAEDPTLVVIDDVQWLDEQSRSTLLRSLRQDEAPALLLADRRPHAPEWPAHDTITLSPLRGTTALKLVQRVYPGVRPDVAAELAAAADGVPLAIVVLARDAAARDVRSGRDANLSVAAVMAWRLDRLPPAAQEAARFVALADAPMPLRVLARALGTPVDQAAETVSELRDVIAVEGTGVAYRHDVLGAAVAKTAPNAVHASARLLAAYEAESGSLAAIVRLALACGRRDRAATAALELARTLAGAGSLGAALRYAEIALENAPPLSTECVIEYALILQMLSRDDEAAAMLRSAIRAALAADDLAAAADLAAAFFSPAVTLERFAELDDLCRRIERTPGCPRPIAAVTAGVRRWSLAYAGRLEEFARLDSRQRRRRWADARSAAYAYALLGDFQRASLELDRYAAGLQHRHARQQTPDNLLESIVNFYFRGTGALDRLPPVSNDGARHPSERAFRALAAVCTGRWDEADAQLGTAGEDVDEPHQVLEVRLLLAALRGALPQDTGPLRTLRSMIRLRRMRHAVSPARWFVLAKGSAVPADIEGFVRETLPVEPMPDDLSASPFALAKLSERFGAERCRAAIDRFPAFRTPWHEAHRMLAHGLIERSDERLRTARSRFDELNCPALAMVAGLELPVPRARDLALAGRLNLRSAGPPAPAPLTKRERTVAEHAAAGASNHEIAEALSISVRTVETHLTKIYGKLGVTSRGAMSALVHRELI